MTLKVHRTTRRQEGASCVFSGRVQAREKEGGVCRTSVQEEQARVCPLVTYHVNPQNLLFSTLVAVIPLDHSLRILWWSGGIWAGPTGPSCAVGLLLCFCRIRIFLLTQNFFFSPRPFVARHQGRLPESAAVPVWWG